MLDVLYKMDIKAIRSFIAIVQCRGVTAAQNKLHLSQSVISAHLKHLEDSLELKLCHRGRSGFELTEAGQMVYDICQDFMQASADFKIRLSNLKAGQDMVTGHIRLAVADELPERFNLALQSAIRDLYCHNPGFHLSIRVQSPEYMEQGIATNECDLGVGYFSHPLSILCYDDAVTETQNLCCGRLHPVYGQSDVALSDLENHYEWVGRGYDNDAVSNRQCYPKNTTATAFHMEATARFILAGSHIGFLPRDYIDAYLAEDKMRILCADEATYTVHHQWAYKPHSSRMVLLFMEKINTYLGG
ncbi:LysR family transcriptional regulator [Snodgrassella sp. CFCC 13594]|uniref:LysR family transcriptional regulator n=1 Tax=Snodgrassella sp. CFCC 13594 TaxID=1775559 RepID=UPI00082B192D|nr:LysR family transcriptional regulator [Snodgrassella sp. CFCC 13594]